MQQHFDLLDLDTTTISDRQAGYLEIEVTEEIMTALCEYRAAQEDYVEPVLFDDEPVYTPTNITLQNDMQTFNSGFHSYLDGLKRLNEVIEMQEKMTKLANDIQFYIDQLQTAIADINNWYTRFNTWLNTADYRKYKDKAKAWDLYKSGLVKKKHLISVLKTAISDTKKKWWEIQEACSNTANGYVWFQYFRLAEDCPFKEWEATDPESFDEQKILKQGPNDHADLLGDTHCIEMNEYKRDRHTGGLRGFWSFKEERETIRKGLENDYLDRLEVSCG